MSRKNFSRRHILTAFAGAGACVALPDIAEAGTRGQRVRHFTSQFPSSLRPFFRAHETTALGRYDLDVLMAMRVRPTSNGSDRTLMSFDCYPGDHRLYICRSIRDLDPDNPIDRATFSGLLSNEVAHAVQGMQALQRNAVLLARTDISAAANQFFRMEMASDARMYAQIAAHVTSGAIDIADVPRVLGNPVLSGRIACDHLGRALRNSAPDDAVIRAVSSEWQIQNSRVRTYHERVSSMSQRMHDRSDAFARSFDIRPNDAPYSPGQVSAALDWSASVPDFDAATAGIATGLWASLNAPLEARPNTP